MPLELLRTRTRTGQIKPVYAEFNKENLNLSDELVVLFQKCTGKPKGLLMDKVSAYEMAGFDYRLVRGLSLVLQRLCIFQVESTVDPVVARRSIFEEASRRGLVATDEMRKEVIRAAAEQLDVTSEELEKSFQADLETELIIKEFTPVTSYELLKRYNLSLTQTLLFRSTFIEVKLSDHWKEVLREIKFHGLMYTAENTNQVFKITVDGPFSLFKLTQRYGTNIAKILPAILQADKWEIKASILRVNQFGKRIFQLNLTNTEVGEKIKPSSLPQESGEVKFDSLVEEKFFKDFSGLKTDWKLIREPSPLIAGAHVFVPDFCFEKNGIRVYLEIVGFWTRKYLELKVKKLQQLHDIDILVAADEHLACDKLKQVKGQLIFYRGTVPLKPILEFLETKEESFLKQEVDNLKLKQLILEGDMVPLRSLAEHYEVSEEAIRRKLKDLEVDGYTLVGDSFISNKKLREIELKIDSLTTQSLSEALRIIEDEGIEKPYDVLSTLKYDIHWKGLDTNKGSIQKRQK